MASSRLCPCTSGATFAACCRAYLIGEREAPTAELLMRSRFTAFATGEAAYLWRTLHPDHDDRARPEAAVLADLKRATATHRYMGLRILDRGETQVLFFAKVFQRGKDLSFVELSDFAHDGVGWRYLAGTPKGLSEIDLETATIASFSR